MLNSRWLTYIVYILVITQPNLAYGHWLLHIFSLGKCHSRQSKLVEVKTEGTPENTKTPREVELTETFLAQDFAGPVKAPKRWISHRESKDPLEEAQLDILLDKAVPEKDILASLRAEANIHTLIFNLNYRLANQPSDLMGRLTDSPTDKALKRIVDYIGQDSPAMNRYLYELGFAQGYKEAKSVYEKPLSPRMVSLPSGKGEFWDLSSGVTSKEILLFELKPEVHYKFFDISSWVVGYLNGIIIAKGLNAEAIQADVRNLPEPEGPVSVIRIKNTWTYVRGFSQHLPRIAKILEPGGIMTFQNSNGIPHLLKSLYNATYEFAITSLQTGWSLHSFDSVYSRDRSKYHITLQKPEGKGSRRSLSEARDIWQQIIDTAEYKFFFRDGRYYSRDELAR